MCGESVEASLPAMLQSIDWALAASIVLGAFHGANPSMGWPFSLLLALRRGSFRALAASCLAIALGHTASIIVVIAPFLALSAITRYWLLVAGAALVVAGSYRIYRPAKRRYVGLSLGYVGLATWGFTAGLAHGSGLMLAPLLGNAALGKASALLAAHAASLVAVMIAMSALGYRLVGSILVRRAWQVNYEILWSAIMVLTGFTAIYVAYTWL